MKQKEAQKLQKLYKQKEFELGLTHSKLSKWMDLDKSQISHMLNGRNPINLHRGLQFCECLKIELKDFSPRLVKEAALLSRAYSGKVNGITGDVCFLVGEDMDTIKRCLNGEENSVQNIFWPGKHSSKTYALAVEGEANSPNLPHGAAAIVDTLEEPDVGSICCYIAGKRLLFGRFNGDGMIEHLNRDWPDRIFKITKRMSFIGVVIGHQIYN